MTAEEKKVIPVVEMLNNIQFIAAAYNQIWTIRAMDTACGKNTIAFVDERSGEEKMVFHHPDGLMTVLLKEIRENGWMRVKEKYLLNDDFNTNRVYLCEKECNCHCHH